MNLEVLIVLSVPLFVLFIIYLSDIMVFFIQMIDNK